MLEVLASVAAEVGLDPDKAREVLESDALVDRVQDATTAAHRLGADSVPVWLVDDKVLIVGAQPHEVFEDALADMAYSPRPGS